MVHSAIASIIVSQNHQAHSSPPPLESHHPVMFPPADTDDPTNKPWGGRKNAPNSPAGLGRGLNSPAGTPSLKVRTDLTFDQGGDASKNEVDPVKKKKTLWDLIALTISMAGAQVAWTVELGCVRSPLFRLGHLIKIVAIDTARHSSVAWAYRPKSPV